MVPGLREVRRGRGAMPGVAHEPEVLGDRHLGRHHLERDGKADRVPGPLHVEAADVGLDAPHLEAAGGNADPPEIGRDLSGRVRGPPDDGHGRGDRKEHQGRHGSAHALSPHPGPGGPDGPRAGRRVVPAGPGEPARVPMHSTGEAARPEPGAPARHAPLVTPARRAPRRRSAPAGAAQPRSSTAGPTARVPVSSAPRCPSPRTARRAAGCRCPGTPAPAGRR